jgi:D-tyrosyl-tRNA(Tyr) deacylase
MKALVQRVSEASVTVEGKTVSSIKRGFLVLLGVMKGDGKAEMDYLIRKVANLRIFHDKEGKMNLSLKDISGEALVVSQFTLAAETRKGNRPSFTEAEAPERAEAVYGEFIERLRAEGIKVQGGVFAAHMKVSLVNDGPVTIMLDSSDRD